MATPKPFGAVDIGPPSVPPTSQSVEATLPESALRKVADAQAARRAPPAPRPAPAMAPRAPAGAPARPAPPRVPAAPANAGAPRAPVAPRVPGAPHPPAAPRPPAAAPSSAGRPMTRPPMPSAPGLARPPMPSAPGKGSPTPNPTPAAARAPTPPPSNMPRSSPLPRMPADQLPTQHQMPLAPDARAPSAALVADEAARAARMRQLRQQRIEEQRTDELAHLESSSLGDDGHRGAFEQPSPLSTEDDGDQTIMHGDEVLESLAARDVDDDRTVMGSMEALAAASRRDSEDEVPRGRLPSMVEDTDADGEATLMRPGLDVEPRTEETMVLAGVPARGPEMAVRPAAGAPKAAAPFHASLFLPAARQPSPSVVAAEEAAAKAPYKPRLSAQVWVPGRDALDAPLTVIRDEPQAHESWAQPASNPGVVGPTSLSGTSPLGSMTPVLAAPPEAAAPVWAPPGPSGQEHFGPGYAGPGYGGPGYAGPGYGQVPPSLGTNQPAAQHAYPPQARPPAPEPASLGFFQRIARWFKS